MGEGEEEVASEVAWEVEGSAVEVRDLRSPVVWVV